MRAETTHQMKGKARGPSEKPFEAWHPRNLFTCCSGASTRPRVDTGNVTRRLPPDSQLIGAACASFAEIRSGGRNRRCIQTSYRFTGIYLPRKRVATPREMQAIF